MKWVTSWGYIGLAAAGVIAVIIALILSAGEPIHPRSIVASIVLLFFIFKGLSNLRKIKITNTDKEEKDNG